MGNEITKLDQAVERLKQATGLPRQMLKSIFEEVIEDEIERRKELDK